LATRLRLLRANGYDCAAVLKELVRRGDDKAGGRAPVHKCLLKLVYKPLFSRQLNPLLSALEGV
jgi:hypothetical protein